jgi:membrane protease subunit HflK
MSLTLFHKIGVILSDLWGRGSDSEDEEKSYRDKRPPELDKMWQRFNDRLNRLFGKKGGGQTPKPASKGMGVAILLMLAIGAAVWLFTGLVVISEGRVGLVMTFGKYTETKQPGLSWRWPFPFQSVEVINKAQIRKVEIGFRGSETNGEPREALMPTDLQLAVQYRLKNANDWVFNNADQEELVKQVAESVIRDEVGKKAMDAVLYESRFKLANAASLKIQKMLDDYASGIELTSVTVQAVRAPESLHAAFDDARKAEEDRQRMESEAKAYADGIIPKAQGVASRLVIDAEAYRTSVVSHAQGDTERFKKIYAEYLKAPRVTRDRMYIETMQEIYTKSTKVMVDSKNGGNMMYLPLDKLISPVHGRESVPQKQDSVPASAVMSSSPAATSGAEAKKTEVKNNEVSGQAMPTEARERGVREREAR